VSHVLDKSFRKGLAEDLVDGWHYEEGIIEFLMDTEILQQVNHL